MGNRDPKGENTLQALHYRKADAKSNAPVPVRPMIPPYGCAILLILSNFALNLHYGYIRELVSVPAGSP
jgi:hypothetical protein